LVKATVEDRLDQPAVWLGLGSRHDRATVWCHDPLPAASALETHRDPHDQRGAVDSGFDARHAAFLSSCCNSPTKLASPSALIRTSRAFSL
jgi:hypothetical protein